MKKEIERKYDIKYIPENIKIDTIQEIEQMFIYKDENTVIRIRKIQTKLKNKKTIIEYIYTVKTKGDIQYDKNQLIANKYEIENNITKELYEKLALKRISNIINKTRVIIPIQNELKVEIDIYYDYLQGFLTAEVEFPNEEDANNFKKPNWIGKEIGYKQFSNRKLAEMTEEQFKSIVSEEVLNRNKIIINQLNEYIKNCY